MRKALFKSEDFLAKAQRREEENIAPRANKFANSVKKSATIATRIGKAKDEIRSVIGELEAGKDIHFVTRGEWSCHQLVAYLLEQTGPADIYIACWTIGEEAARILLQLIEAGLIRELKAVFDLRAQQRKPAAYQLATSIVSDMRTATCHAKVTVIWNESWQISISGSANYTRNPRIEAGVLSTVPEVAAFHRQWIEDVLKDADPFE